MMKFLYNPKTRTIHIKDYCCHVKGACSSYIAFDTENEILAYDGRAAGMCKLCQKEREKR